MTINPAKSVCLRIGPNWNSVPACISTLNGAVISWQQSFRYLGVHIVAGCVFSCSIDSAHFIGLSMPFMVKSAMSPVRK